MKKLLITVNGQKYEVEVDVVEDEFSSINSQGYPNPILGSQPADISPSPVKFNEVTSFLSNRQHQQTLKPLSKSNQLNSPLNGTVLEINVQPGSQVKEKEVLMAIEAMKMKTNIFSESEGVVKSVNVSIGDKVSQGTILITFE